jgi:hypothetical protein
MLFHLPPLKARTATIAELQRRLSIEWRIYEQDRSMR